jgi:hypothetical protein
MWLVEQDLWRLLAIVTVKYEPKLDMPLFRIYELKAII